MLALADPRRHVFGVFGRHGHDGVWPLVGTFGALTVSLPRVRLLDGDGGEKEWRSQTVQAYKRLTKRTEAIIANTYLTGASTRRVRALLCQIRIEGNTGGGPPGG